MEWIFMAIALVIVAKSPLGLAMADRIRHGGPPRGGALGQEVDEFRAQVVDELRLLRDDVDELSERVDFTERALATVRRNDALPHGPDGA